MKHKSYLVLTVIYALCAGLTLRFEYANVITQALSFIATAWLCGQLWLRENQEGLKC